MYFTQHGYHVIVLIGGPGHIVLKRKQHQCCDVCHIRPHSPLPIPSLSPGRRSPHLSLDCPIVPCLGVAAGRSVPAWVRWLWRKVCAHRFEPTDTIHSPARRFRCDIEWLESEIRLMNLAATVQLLLKTSCYNGTVSDVLLVGVTTTLEDD